MKVCKSCSARYNIEYTSDECSICNNIFNKLENLNIPYKTVSIRVHGFQEPLFQFNSTLSFDIKKFLIEKYNLKISSTDPDLIINISPDGVSFENPELFLFGRYYKIKNNISQKRWRNRKFLSIEEIIGEHFKKIYQAENYYMHASGREDIDAYCLAGRPFVLELVDPKIRDNFQGFFESDQVKAIIYGKVRRVFRSLVSDSHFDKTYLCYHRELHDSEIEILNSIKDLKISQYTPTRVQHRRVNKTRYRKVYWIKAFKNFSYIHCEAGLYVKELFTGDNGNTKPNLSEMLNKPIKCEKLIVVRILDRFLDYSFNLLRL